MILIRLSQSNSRHPRPSKVSWLNLCKSKKMRVVTLRNIYGGSTMFFRRKKYRLVSVYESFLIFHFSTIIVKSLKFASLSSRSLVKEPILRVQTHLACVLLFLVCYFPINYLYGRSRELSTFLTYIHTPKT